MGSRGRTACGRGLLVLFALGGTSGAAASPEEVSVVTRFGPAGEWARPPHDIALSPAPPEDDSAPLESATVLLGAARFAGERLALAVDVRPDAERIWIDHDFDGELVDDERAWWSRDGDAFVRREHILLPAVRGEQRAFAEIELRLKETRDGVELAHALCRRGTVEVGGRLRDVLLLDGDHDARFDSPHDRILLDIDGDGQLDAARETVHVDVPFAVAGEGWVATRPRPPQARFELRRVDVAPEVPSRAWREVASAPSGVVPVPSGESLESLERWLELVPETSAATRRDVLAQIGALGTESAFAVLAEHAVVERTPSVRAAAVRAMGHPAYRCAHAEEIAEFASGEGAWRDPERGIAAIEALHAMDWPGRKRLYVDLLDDHRWLVSGAAARHLAYLPDAESRRLATLACTTLTSGVRSGPSADGRLRAYRGVRTIPGGPSRELMNAMAESHHAGLVALALADLRDTGDPAAAELARSAARLTNMIWNLPNSPTADEEMSPYSREWTVGRRALGDELIRALGADDDPASTASLLLLVERAPMDARVALRRQLAARRSDAEVSEVVRGLSAHRSTVREIAAQALAGTPGADVTRALAARVAKERDDRVLLALLKSLGSRRDPEALPALLEAAHDDRLPGFALRAAAACARSDVAVRRLIRSRLEDPEWEQRVRGVLALRASGDVGALAQAIARLDDERWSVRVAVIDTLRLVRSRDSVSPLIDRLEAEPRLRLRLAIADALFALTGMDLGPDAAPWQLWHGEHGESFEMPASPPARRPTIESSTAAFFGMPIDSDHATFVLDRSGSMLQSMDPPSRVSRLRASTDEALGAVRALPDDAFVNVLLFHMSTRAWKNRLVPLIKRNRKSLARRVRSAAMGPQTDLFRALRAALRDPESDTIVLLTDGLPNTGDHREPDDLLQAIERLNETLQVAIHCVALGTSPELLSRLAEGNAGHYVRR